eukprot:4679562-Amphidinium_carterae.1
MTTYGRCSANYMTTTLADIQRLKRQTTPLAARVSKSPADTPTQDDTAETQVGASKRKNDARKRAGQMNGNVGSGVWANIMKTNIQDK